MKLFTHVAFLILFALPLFGTAQSKPLTEKEYNQTWRASFAKAQTLNRRHVQHIEIYRDGKVFSSEDWLYEYVMPDRIHYVHVDTYGGKTTRTEQIDIGKSAYCKHGDDQWTVVTGMCVGGGVGGIGDGISKETFSVEDVVVDGKPLKRYRWYHTSNANYPNNPEKNGVYFSESTFWLRDDGLIVKEETRSGKLDPTTVGRKETETYEYEPKDLKIDAPGQPLSTRP